MNVKGKIIKIIMHGTFPILGGRDSWLLMIIMLSREPSIEKEKSLIRMSFRRVMQFKSHFEKLLNPQSQSVQVADDAALEYAQYIPLLDDPLTLQELEADMQKINKKKKKRVTTEYVQV